MVRDKQIPARVLDLRMLALDFGEEDSADEQAGFDKNFVDTAIATMPIMNEHYTYIMYFDRKNTW